MHNLWILVYKPKCNIGIQVRAQNVRIVYYNTINVKNMGNKIETY